MDNKLGLDEVIEHFDELDDAMREAKPPRTLEEKVADMKRRGIDPAKSYQNWDDED